jgi:NADH:ubiquinone oxidoreductase subunit D
MQGTIDDNRPRETQVKGDEYLRAVALTQEISKKLRELKSCLIKNTKENTNQHQPTPTKSPSKTYGEHHASRYQETTGALANRGI